MTDHDALLAAVLANPEDDLPRLVFADWMEESGQPALIARAHFIRAQIEAASLPEGNPDRVLCDQRADDLYRDFGAGWNATLPDWTKWDTRLRYHRGFIGELITTPRRLLRDAQELAVVAPVDTVQVRTENTTHTRQGLRAFAKDWPWLSRVRTLRIGPGLSFRGLGIASDPDNSPELFLLTHFRNLNDVRRLSLVENDLDDAWIVSFASQFRQTAFAATLVELDLSRNQITDAGAHTLATARGLDRLLKLDLRENRITPVGLTFLRHRFGDRVDV